MISPRSGRLKIAQRFSAGEPTKINEEPAKRAMELEAGRSDLPNDITYFQPSVSRTLLGLLINSARGLYNGLENQMSFQHQDTPAVIETEEENERILKVIESLMDKGEDLSLHEENHLRSLAKLVEDFEERYYHLI